MKLTTKIFIIALCATAFCACKTKKVVPIEYPATNFQPVEEVVTPEPVLEEEEEVVVEPTVEEDDLLNARNEQVELSDSEQNSGLQLKKYNIVVGSFSNKANAERLQATLNQEGYNALVAMNENNMFRVVAISSDEFNSARDNIQTIRNRFSDAWVLILR